MLSSISSASFSKLLRHRDIYIYYQINVITHQQQTNRQSKTFSRITRPSLTKCLASKHCPNMENTEYKNQQLVQSCNPKRLKTNEHYDIKSAQELDFIYIQSGTITIKYTTTNSTQPYSEDMIAGKLIDIAYWKNDEGITKYIQRISAKEESEIITIPYMTYFSIIDDCNCFDLNTANFIVESVPKLAGFGINTKADAIGLFKKMKFGPKDMIVKEGDVSRRCLIKE